MGFGGSALSSAAPQDLMGTGTATKLSCSGRSCGGWIGQQADDAGQWGHCLAIRAGVVFMFRTV